MLITAFYKSHSGQARVRFKHVAQSRRIRQLAQGQHRDVNYVNSLFKYCVLYTLASATFEHQNKKRDVATTLPC